MTLGLWAHELMAAKRERPEADIAAIIKILEGAPHSKSSSLSEHDLSPEEVQLVLQHLNDHWCSPPENSNISEVAAERFGVLDLYQSGELLPYGDGGLKRLVMQKQLSIVRLRYHFVRLGIMDLEPSSEHVAGSDDVAGAASKTLFARIHECLHRLQDILMSSLLTKKCLDPLWACASPASESDPFNIRAFDSNKLSSSQKFLVFVLDQIQRLGLRRYKGSCYAEIDSPPIKVDGKPKIFKTHAWRKYMDISEFVNRCAPKEIFFELWRTLVDGPAKNRTIEQLTNGYDVQFPDLVPDRAYHAFQNGIYDTVKRKFYEFGIDSPPSDITCCKYHEKMINFQLIQYDNWRDIPTPSFDKILSVQLNHINHVECIGSTPQKWTSETAAEENERISALYEEEYEQKVLAGWSPEKLDNEFKRPEAVEEGQFVMKNEGSLVKDWAYVFVGRLLHPVGLFDSWQVMPMFVGRAGTGKSLILTLIGKFFQDCDVSTIANNVQQGFGLETVYDKMLWMIKEVKHDLNLDQAQLQSMITGEEMSIQRKGLPAEQIVWSAPGVMAGNELANWQDNAGSMSRRLVLFYFMKKVHNSNPKLAEELMDSLPELIHKCNSAYAEACARFGHCDIWSKNPELVEAFRDDPSLEKQYRGSRTILPSYFHANKSNFKQQTHLMENLLANRDEVLVPGKETGRGMPFELDIEGKPSFKTHANAYFKKQDAKFQWTKSDRYLSVFEDWNLEVRQLTAKDVQQKRNSYAGHDYATGTNWIFGILPAEDR